MKEEWYKVQSKWVLQTFEILRSFKGRNVLLVQIAVMEMNSKYLIALTIENYFFYVPMNACQLHCGSFLHRCIKNQAYCSTPPTQWNKFKLKFRSAWFWSCEIASVIDKVLWSTDPFAFVNVMVSTAGSTVAEKQTWLCHLPWFYLFVYPDLSKKQGFPLHWQNLDLQKFFCCVKNAS